MISISTYGDRALLVNFEQKIDPDINEKVISLYQDLLHVDSPAINFLVPAYCSLTVGFNPTLIDFNELTEFILYILNEKQNRAKGPSINLKIPVCYDLEFGLDLDQLSTDLKISIDEIVKLHTSQSYQVYMIGFLPGFPYMGKIPDRLKCKRKQSPRVRLPEGSVGIAGEQTGIYPTEAPGGWQILGRTPIPLFNPNSDQPCLLNPGDQVSFEPIEKEIYFKMIEELEMDEFKWEILNG